MKRTYRFVASVDGAPGIECLQCGLISWNRNDVENRYCGQCHVFHERITVAEFAAEAEGKKILPIDDECDANAKARARKVSERLQPSLPEMNRLVNKALDEPTPKRKVIWLWRATHPLKEATKGLVPCREGCAHCCHTPVLISHLEAEVMAEQTGRKMVSPSTYVIEPHMDYLGTPCTFLVNNRCSIYASRPFACRVHYNMDRDESRCVLDPEYSKQVPFLNRHDYDMAYANAIGTQDVRYADIRDFFPPSA